MTTILNLLSFLNVKGFMTQVLHIVIDPETGKLSNHQLIKDQPVEGYDLFVYLGIVGVCALLLSLVVYFLYRLKKRKNK